MCKKKIISDYDTYYRAINKKNLNDEYLEKIYYMMQQEGLIEGLVFKKAWGNIRILANDEDEMDITSDGIRYLKDNSKMEIVKNYLIENLDIIADLITLVGLNVIK